MSFHLYSSRCILKHKNNRLILDLKLKSGFAEIFGTELSRNKEYTFNSGGKFAVFSFNGCTVLISFYLY